MISENTLIIVFSMVCFYIGTLFGSILHNKKVLTDMRHALDFACNAGNFIVGNSVHDYIYSLHILDDNDIRSFIVEMGQGDRLKHK